MTDQLKAQVVEKGASALKVEHPISEIRSHSPEEFHCVVNSSKAMANKEDLKKLLREKKLSAKGTKKELEARLM